MTSGVPLETCWAFKKLWNNKFYYKAASCWYFYWIMYDARIHEYHIFPSGFPSQTFMYFCSPLYEPHACQPQHPTLFDQPNTRHSSEILQNLVKWICFVRIIFRVSNSAAKHAVKLQGNPDAYHTHVRNPICNWPLLIWICFNIPYSFLKIQFWQHKLLLW